MSVAITVILINLLIPILFKSKYPTNKGGKIVFEFDKSFRMIMLISIIFFFSLGMCFLIRGFMEDTKDDIVGSIIFVLFSLTDTLLYVFFRNKKVIYTDGTLYAYNILGRERIFNIKDIKEAIEKPSNGMKLIFNDNSKVKIDVELTNYKKIKDILEKNNITYKDKNGNNAPKGW